MLGCSCVDSQLFWCGDHPASGFHAGRAPLDFDCRILFLVDEITGELRISPLGALGADVTYLQNIETPMLNLDYDFVKQSE